MTRRLAKALTGKMRGELLCLLSRNLPLERQTSYVLIPMDPHYPPLPLNNPKTHPYATYNCSSNIPRSFLFHSIYSSSLPSTWITLSNLSIGFSSKSFFFNAVITCILSPQDLKALKNFTMLFCVL